MRELLHLFPRPAHYAGMEEGAVRKNPDAVRLHIALAFPDVYEVGMSYLGQKILYGIVNSRPDWWAERVMAPEAEACAILRQTGIPLATIESDTPLNRLAAVCFSVTHELCFTDILNMLDLAQIPLRTADRSDSLEECPLIMAGGGAMLGAEPLSPFIDLVALGDGEELLPEILEALQEARRKGIGRRKFLETARHIHGVYIPSFFSPDTAGGLVPLYADCRPARRIVSDLDAASYPQSQVVPVGAVHNRLSLEIARGCARGCRFCHAGMIYRPVRERRPETVAALLDGCLERTGFDEVSFLALSAGDCTALKTVYDNSWIRCQKEQTALCLPSLRVGSVDDGIMAKMAELRRPGATLAPEAGSQRLRDAINKGISEEDLILHLKKLLEHGWRQVKLYFMIGLPGETDSDLEAIVALCRKARDAGGPGAPKLQITASVSPFVPKPFTPFQWEEQISLPEMERRINFLRSLFKTCKGIRFKWHEPAASHLEGILARGDRRLADVVEKAFRKGAIFCGWHDFFKFEPWLEALDECGLAADEYTRARDKNEPLPWEHIEAGIRRDFLWREAEKARQGRTTPDCRFNSCSQCGACTTKNSLSPLGSAAAHRLVFASRDQGSSKPALDGEGKLLLKDTQPAKPGLAPRLCARACSWRVWHLKKGAAAFYSQLELQAALQRALRRASIPVAFSQGFHPLPLLSFGRALPVGIESEAEWFIVTLHSLFAPDKLMRQLNSCLPAEFAITHVEPGDKKAGNPVSETFAIRFTDYGDLMKAADSFSTFYASDSRLITRTTKKGERTQDIRPLLLGWHIVSGADFCGIVFDTDWSDDYVSPLLLAKTILDPVGKKAENLRLTKLRQLFADGREYGAEKQPVK